MRIMDTHPYSARRKGHVRGKGENCTAQHSIGRPHSSSLASCVIEFNPTSTSLYGQGSYRIRSPEPSTAGKPSSLRPHSRQSDHDGLMRPSNKEARAGSSSTFLLSRTKRQTTHELLNSMIGDHIIFSESTSMPGVPIVFRPPEERAKNPERLNLDRRNLVVCPVLEGEEKLRLLNLQHNFIRHIENIGHLKRLVFLDLYANCIEGICGLKELVSLRVLMLGKNRIQRVTGLETLSKLDVLDLHGNQICDVSGLGHLSHLRVLNLAGNEITVVSGLFELKSLTELNLRRNRVRQVFDLDQLPSLQRLFLSHNLIHEWQDVLCLSHSRSLAELSLDSTPFSTRDQAYRMTVLSNMPHLHHLDMIPVSDEERFAMAEIRRNEQALLKEKEHKQRMKERRNNAIARIRRQWERLQEGGLLQSSSSSSLTDVPRGIGGSVSSASMTALATQNSSTGATRTLSAAQSRFLVQPTATPPLSYMEVVEGHLHLYGIHALKAVQTGELECPAGSVKGVAFHFVAFADVVPVLSTLGATFPAVKTVVFHSNGIQSLPELNALSFLPPIDSLSITTEGNPVTKMATWRRYTIYRISHLSLSTLNGVEVTAEDLIESEEVFGELGRLASSLPEGLLMNFVRQQKAQRKRVGRKRPTPQEPLSRAPLLYKQTLEHADGRQPRMQPSATHKVSESIAQGLTSGAVAASKRLTALEELWPSVFKEVVCECADQMADMNHFMREGMRTLLA